MWQNSEKENVEVDEDQCGQCIILLTGHLFLLKYCWIVRLFAIFRFCYCWSSSCLHFGSVC